MAFYNIRNIKFNFKKMNTNNQDTDENDENKTIGTTGDDMSEDMNMPDPMNDNLDKEAPTGPLEDDYSDGNASM